MKDTQFTRVSATVFHKHKYITNPSITPPDRVIAAAKALADEIKDRMPHHLSATSLDHLERLNAILKQRMPQIDAPPTTFPIPQSPPATPPGRVPHAPPQRQNTPLLFPHLTSATATPPPRVNPPPRVVPPPRLAPLKPPRVATVATPRRSPRLQAQAHIIPCDNYNDTPANNTCSRAQRRSITQ